jgi:hypothetical protein
MEITKGELKKIISEELEKIESEEFEIDNMLNEFVDIYSIEGYEDYVTSDSVADFMEALNETHIPKSALYAFLSALPQEKVKTILKESL